MLQLIFALLSWLVILPPDLPDSSAENASIGNRIALSFTDAPGFSPDASHFELAQSAGIELIEFHQLSHLAGFPAESFYLLFNLNIEYPTPHYLRINRNEIIRNTISELRNVSDRYPGRIIATGLFTFPYELHRHYDEIASSIADSVLANFETSLYFRSSFPQPPVLPEGFSFASGLVSTHSAGSEQLPGVFHFRPGNDPGESLGRLGELLNQTFQHENSITVIPADWFFSRIEKQSDLIQVFETYSKGETVEFPLPAGQQQAPKANWSVILLFLIWASFLLHYRYQPTYSSVLTRYFIHHYFFVIDVKENRLRNIKTGLILLFQHALLTGLFVYVSTEILIGQLGLNVLSAYFPFLIISGYELLSLFTISVLSAFMLQILSVFWIYLLNQNMGFLSQALNLYSWPLHINLIVVTVLVVLNQQASADYLIVTFAAVFAAVWFLSFNLAAIDSAKFLEEYRAAYLFGTMGIHMIILVAFFWILLTSPGFIQPLQLAFSLP